MSQEQNLEEGTTRHLSVELRYGTTPVSGNLSRDSHPVVEIQEIRSIRKLLKSSFGMLAAGPSCVKKIFNIHGSCRNWIFLMWCVIVIFADTWFLYIPVVNDDKKCIKFDKDLWTVAGAARSVFDLFYIIDNIFRLPTGIRKRARKQSWLFFLVDFLIILPIPQVLLILVRIQRIRGAEFLFAVKFFFLQHVLRAVQIYTVYMKAQVPSKPAELALGFSFSYIQTSNVIGALWYILAIETESQCWKKACINHHSCNGSFHCDDHFGDYKFLNDFCPPQTHNSTIFDSGIFSDAFQSGVVETTDFKTRLYYCFRWGLQNLSSFGQGLQTSTNPWENIFAICITASGVWLLVILVGKIQTYTKSGAVSDNIRQREEELEQWLPFRKLSQHLQQQIKYQLYKWQETRDFNIENLVNNLPEDLGREIKRELCLELLKKVEDFGKCSKASLENLCESIKPVVYTASSYIFHEGSSIDKMLFVVQGNLWIHKTGNTIAAPPSDDNFVYNGDVCGEELVAWAQEYTKFDPSSPNLPISTRTIQAHTKVEAFFLTADDLKNLAITKCSGTARFMQATRFIKLFLDDVKGIFSRSRMSTQTLTFTKEEAPSIVSRVDPEIVAEDQ